MKTLSTLILLTLSASSFAAFEFRLPLCGNCLGNWTVPGVSVWTPSTGNPTLMVASDGTLAIANAGVTVKGISLEGDVAGFTAAIAAQGGYGGVWTVTNAGVTPTPSGVVSMNGNADGAATDYTRLVLSQINTDGASFQDCGGNNLNIWFDGSYPTPAGWEDPNVPPVDPDWALSWEWETGGQSRQPVPDALIPGWIETQITGGWDESYVDGKDVINDDRVEYQRYFRIGTGSWFSGTVVATRYACIPAEGSLSCPVDGPTVTQWPVDGRYDLSFNSGQFSTNTFDSEAPAQGLFSRVSYASSGGTGTVTGLIDPIWQWQSTLTATCGGAQSSPAIKFGSSNQKEIIF